MVAIHVGRALVAGHVGATQAIGALDLDRRQAQEVAREATASIDVVCPQKTALITAEPLKPWGRKAALVGQIEVLPPAARAASRGKDYPPSRSGGRDMLHHGSR